MAAAGEADADCAAGLAPCFLDCEPDAAVVDLEPDHSEWADLEPFFFDEAAALADHKRRVQREQEEAHKKQLLEARRAAERAALDRIYDYDPKLGRPYYTRIEFVDLATFDLDEESPLGPMRETEASIDVQGTVCREEDGKEEFVPCSSANVFSVKIISSDVGFPIDVYGSVIARDILDLKYVYLFRCDRDHSQLILTKDESLILTGPKRGLALAYQIYFEFDLKIKGDTRQRDKPLSKGYITLYGVSLICQDEMAVETDIIDSRLSDVAITYAVVKRAATFAAEVVQGSFYGEIAARTTSIRDSIVLYDSKQVTEAMDGNASGRGVIQLMRRVVAVGLKEKLIVTVAARTGDGKTKSMTIRFTPGASGGDEKEISCGFMKMRLNVTWSIIKR
ncbi:LOW QUALITY PROTEIN: hypothetical protein U9M48_009571, partial [Paspalum notatum var. saurae]